MLPDLRSFVIVSEEDKEPPASPHFNSFPFLQSLHGNNHTGENNGVVKFSVT